MSSSIPPNNLEQLVAWIRLFAEQTNANLQNLKQDLLKMQNTSQEEE